MSIIVPLTVLLIFVILYMMFKSMKWAMLIMVTVLVAPIGGLLALLISGTNLSVSSGLGFLALFGVSCADRRDYGGIHQSTAGARAQYRGCRRGRRRF